MTFNYLVISDIHLGHPRTTTEEILDHLNLFFDNFNRYKDLDAIFIAGDLFDRLLDNHSREYHHIVLWCAKLLWFCVHNNVKLRVLEGTPSHDWKQSRIFDTLVKAKNIKGKIDFSYVDVVHVEFLRDKGLHILYVPDEAASNASKVLALVDEAMKKAQVTQVDIAIMHGAFSYQIPMMKSDQTHDERAYLKRVKHLIHIGHVHTHSTYDRIVAQGSFDRLAHGEESPKGAVVAQVTDEGHQYRFIENKHAKIYKTIKVPDKPLDELLPWLDKRIKQYPNWSYIRLLAKSTSDAVKHWKDIVKLFPSYKMSKKTVEELEEEQSSSIDKLIQDGVNYTPIQITEENIITLTLEEIQKQLGTEEISIYQQRLEALKEMV